MPRQPAADASPALTTVLAELAHDLRNATANLWTGLQLLDGADPAESTEIVHDLHDPAGYLLVVVDLLVETARSEIAAAPAQEPLKPLLARAAARCARVGVQVDHMDVDDAAHVTTVAGAYERLVTTTLAAIGCDAAHALYSGDGTIELRTSGPTPARGGSLGAVRPLVAPLAAAAGVLVQIEPDRIRITPAGA